MFDLTVNSLFSFWFRTHNIKAINMENTETNKILEWTSTIKSS